MATCLRNGDFVAQHNVSRRDFAAIDPLVRLIVGTKRGTCEGNAGKETARTRVAQYLRSHIRIGSCFRVTAFGSCRDGSVCAQFDLAVKNRSRAFLIHDQENQVGGFSAELKSNTAAFQCVPLPGRPKVH